VPGSASLARSLAQGSLDGDGLARRSPCGAPPSRRFAISNVDEELEGSIGRGGADEHVRRRRGRPFWHSAHWIASDPSDP